MKRGQAALEFLTTYGFAFLIILVMIGALSYFGVLNPARFLPERCIVGNEFDCRDFQLKRPENANQTVTVNGTNVSGIVASVILANNIGNTVDIEGGIDAARATGFTEIVGTNSYFSYCTSKSQVGGGEIARIDCNVSGFYPAAGEKVKMQLDFQYKELGGEFWHPIKGEIFATLQ